MPQLLLLLPASSSPSASAEGWPVVPVLGGFEDELPPVVPVLEGLEDEPLPLPVLVTEEFEEELLAVSVLKDRLHFLFLLGFQSSSEGDSLTGFPEGPLHYMTDLQTSCSKGPLRSAAAGCPDSCSAGACHPGPIWTMADILTGFPEGPLLYSAGFQTICSFVAGFLTSLFVGSPGSVAGFLTSLFIDTLYPTMLLPSRVSVCKLIKTNHN
ncbi:hypothetical protein CRENBAI_023810 [Crenichthys baileyi]|uniref:Uncharacterized protein n=1 Tax=Crenichthys baileyi TaxID=28760 RepID=A0AAV9S996_9TELE